MEVCLNNHKLLLDQGREMNLFVRKSSDQLLMGKKYQCSDCEYLTDRIGRMKGHVEARHLPPGNFRQ